MNATPQALEEFKKILNSEEIPTAGIRIFTQQGCCGPALQISVAERPSVDDKQISIDSVNFFVENQADEMLAGVTIDYGPSGFKINGMSRGGGCCG